MGGKGSAPPAPDYVGAANAQAAASREITDVANWANRPQQYSPFGSTTWGAQAITDPATGMPVTQWTQSTQLAPGLQSALDAQIGTQLGRSQLAGGFMERVANEYSQPFNWSNLPQMAQLQGSPQLQTGLADYTPGLSTNVQQQNVVGGFNFGGPQMNVNPMTGGIQSGVQDYGLNANFNPMTSSIQSGVQNYGLNADFNPMTGNLAANVGQEAVQRQLATQDNPALPQFDSGYRDQVAQTLMERMVPLHERQTNQLQTQLANQGFTVGSEGYKRAMDELNQRQAAERYNALDTAGNEAQRLYNMQMGTAQQAFNQDVAGGQFANQAAAQAFGQGLQANQFQNQAQAQAYNQMLGAQQASNQALGQQFGQGLQAGQFGNQATAQAYNQMLGAQQASNQALGQQFGQGLQAGQFGNQANAQAYNQMLGAGQFANQAQNQYYNQLMGQANLANQAGQQAFNQNLAAQQFQNQALGQASALDIARMQAMNQAGQQQFGLNQQAAQFQNQLRQQAIAEEAQRRGMSLNEMNALLSGQQVNMPNMPSFSQALRSETPNILGATQMGYDAQLGAYNAQQAQNANMMGGLFSLGSAAMPFMFSDRRLKRNIKRIGTHDSGVGIYAYTIFGKPEIGVMAQELQQVKPELVKRHANGYLMVDYGGL